MLHLQDHYSLVQGIFVAEIHHQKNFWKLRVDAQLVCHGLVEEGIHHHLWDSTSYAMLSQPHDSKEPM